MTGVLSGLIHVLAAPSQPMWATWDGATQYHLVLVRRDKWARMQCGINAPASAALYLVPSRDVLGNRCEKCFQS